MKEFLQTVFTLGVLASSCTTAKDTCLEGDWISNAVAGADNSEAAPQLLRLWAALEHGDEAPAQRYGSMGSSDRYDDLYLEPAYGNAFELRTVLGQPRGRIRFECQGEHLLSLWDDPKGPRHRRLWQRPPPGYAPVREHQPQPLRRRLQPQFGRKAWQISAEATHRCEVQQFEPDNPRYATLNQWLWKEYVEALQILDACRVQESERASVTSTPSCQVPQVLAIGERFAVLRHLQVPCGTTIYPFTLPVEKFSLVKIDPFSPIASENPGHASVLRVFPECRREGCALDWLRVAWSPEPQGSPWERLLGPPSHERRKYCKDFTTRWLAVTSSVAYFPEGIEVMPHDQNMECMDPAQFTWSELKWVLTPLGRKLHHDLQHVERSYRD